jgi:hypothetical protein
MGVAALLLKSNVEIDKANFAAALKAIQGIPRKDSADSEYAFVEEGYREAISLHGALMKWRWEPNYCNDENIVGLDFLGEKLGDDDVLFATISPFVKDNSEICMASDQGVVWRWLFRGGVAVMQQGTIHFEEN